jgi:hypothetical protein
MELTAKSLRGLADGDLLGHPDYVHEGAMLLLLLEIQNYNSRETQKIV